MTRVGTGLLVSSWEGEMGWHNSMVIALHPRPQIGAKRTRAKLKRRTASCDRYSIPRAPEARKPDDRFTTNTDREYCLLSRSSCISISCLDARV